MQISADLHIHSKYSMATSKNMDLPTLASEAKKKGIDVIGTGDCLHDKWLGEIKKNAASSDAGSDDGSFKIKDTTFVLTCEVEDKNRVHHLLIVPSISKAEELREAFIPCSKNLDADGRPTLKIDGVEIAQYAKDAGALIGPAHAFTPWTAMYAAHDSLKSCYGDLSDYISFVELGLSADSSYADRIPELRDLTFLSNSDAHSPWTNKFAREFNRFCVQGTDFSEIRLAILRQQGRYPTLNAGFYPQEGKYNESACIKCLVHYTYDDAVSIKWKCTCGGRIKKGVQDRVQELSDSSEPIHPPHRPPYIHIVPLSEIIRMAIGYAGINTKGVQSIWEKLVGDCGSEISVLIDVDIDS
ncbi:MAG: endonuclease Q family protein, partial [Methanosarcinales archaeon]|nr:endonuclease Q family protein [Methanosarcinales archaeon]